MRDRETSSYVSFSSTGAGGRSGTISYAETVDRIEAVLQALTEELPGVQIAGEIGIRVGGEEMALIPCWFAEEEVARDMLPAFLVDCACRMVHAGGTDRLRKDMHRTIVNLLELGAETGDPRIALGVMEGLVEGMVRVIQPERWTGLRELSEKAGMTPGQLLLTFVTEVSNRMLEVFFRGRTAEKEREED